MYSDPEANKTEMFVAAYSEARRIFIEIFGPLKVAPYQHIEMENAVPAGWCVYHQMLEEHTRELANELNKFGHQCCQLAAWAQVLPSYTKKDRIALMREFVDAIATSCVSHPHILKARFAFTASHLAHQERLITEPGWKEENLPEDGIIGTSTMVAVSKPGKEYDSFKREFDNLCSNAYVAATGSYRNKYHHRYPPRFEDGLTQLVMRNVTKNGRTDYGFGGVEPLKLRQLAPLVEEQHDIALRCFDSYSALARKQLSGIYMSDREHK